MNTLTWTRPFKLLNNLFEWTINVSWLADGCIHKASYRAKTEKNFYVQEHSNKLDCISFQSCAVFMYSSTRENKLQASSFLTLFGEKVILKNF